MATANGAKSSRRLMTVAPKDIRFTQDTIPAYFDHPHAGDRLDKAVELIMSKRLSVDAFPHMRVLLLKDQLWTLNNRSLWVFRKARVAQVMVRLQGRFDDDSHSFIGSYMYKLMLPENFFPQVRGDCRLDFNHHSERNDLHTDMGAAKRSKLSTARFSRSQSIAERRKPIDIGVQLKRSIFPGKRDFLRTSIDEAQGVQLVSSRWKMQAPLIKLKPDGCMFVTVLVALKVTLFVALFLVAT